MLLGSIFTGAVPAPNAEAPSDESILAWMGELEASLNGSRKALLALDLAGIEWGTGEQVRLIREFDAMHRPAREDGARRFSVRAPELEQELRRSRERILEAERLQAALLARAQSKLRVLANMLAGPSTDYGQLLVRKSGGPRAWDSQQTSMRDWE